MTTVADYSYRIAKHPRLEIPTVTLRTVCALVCWRVAECNARDAPSGATNNLLNTTLPRPGSTDYNTVPVQNYESVEQGVWAHVLTLTNGRYDEVLDFLRRDTSAPDVLAAVGRSPWGSFKDWPPIRIYDFCAGVYNRFGVEAFATVRETPL